MNRMKKQLKVQITVTEEELEQIKQIAAQLGNKPATICKQLLMEKVRNYITLVDSPQVIIHRTSEIDTEPINLEEVTNEYYFVDKLTKGL